jgi:hypothetical protein
MTVCFEIRLFGISFNRHACGARQQSYSVAFRAKPCPGAMQICHLVCHFMPLEPFALKYGCSEFLLIGMRAAPDNKVILWPLEQNLAPERYKLYGCFKSSLRGGLFCVPHNDCRWLDEAGCAEKRGS